MAKFYLKHHNDIHPLPYAKTLRIAIQDALEKCSDLNVNKDDKITILNERLSIELELDSCGK